MVVVVVLALGCGTKVLKLESDPAFTYENMRAGRMGIGGVVASAHTQDSDSSSAAELATMFRLSLLDKRGDLDIIPADQVRSKVGDELYTSALDQFRDTGEPEPGTLSGLSEEFKEAARYLVFARIEENHVSQDSWSRKEEVDGEEKIEKGLSGKREMAVSFKIYDLDQEKRVQTGVLSRKDSNTNKYILDSSGGYDDSKTVLENVADFVLKDSQEEPTYPDPPSTESLVRKIFETFADKLPKDD
jgi:hypothetical protein